MIYPNVVHFFCILYSLKTVLSCFDAPLIVLGVSASLYEISLNQTFRFLESIRKMIRIVCFLTLIFGHKIGGVPQVCDVSYCWERG